MEGRADRVATADESTITARYERLSRASLLDERGRRLWAAMEARSAGRGGIAAVVSATGISESTVRRGLRELDLGEELPPARVRRPGAGRTPIAAREPGLLEDLDRLIEPVGHDADRSPLRWTCKSAATLAAALRERDHQVVDRTVLRLLKATGYSLQANRQTSDGARHPDRDAQFEYVNRTVRAAIANSEPVISVGLSRREPEGHQWTQVGITGENAQLTASTILAWWDRLGKQRYPSAKTLTVSADCGGVSSERTRSWRLELQGLSDRAGLELVVCHFPAGTTRWVGVEHRLLNTVGHGRRGGPLSHEVVISLIARPTPGRRMTSYCLIQTRDRVADIELTGRQPQPSRSGKPRSKQTGTTGSGRQ
jgi:Rhodopirellula transposase DDE domain